jgi:hypothetical protein
MTSNGETTKTKVVDLKKLCNFVVENFFVEFIFSRKIMYEPLKFEI